MVNPRNFRGKRSVSFASAIAIGWWVSAFGFNYADNFTLFGGAAAQEHTGGGGGGSGTHDTGTHGGGAGGGGHAGGGRRGPGRGAHGSGLHKPGGQEGQPGLRGTRHVPTGIGDGSEMGNAPSGMTGAGSRITGRGLARLNAARAFLSPGFDPARISAEGETESPLYNLSLYRDELVRAEPDFAQASIYLGNAATIEVTSSAVQKVNQMMGITVTDPAAIDAIAAAAEKQRQSRKEEHEIGHETSSPH